MLNILCGKPTSKVLGPATSNYERNFPPLCCVEKTRISVYVESPHNFNIFFWEGILSLKRKAPWIHWLPLWPRVKVKCPGQGHIWSWEFEFDLIRVMWPWPRDAEKLKEIFCIPFAFECIHCTCTGSWDHERKGLFRLYFVYYPFQCLRIWGFSHILLTVLLIHWQI